MKAKTIEAGALVYDAASSSAHVIATLPAGAEIELGPLVKNSDGTWVTLLGQRDVAGYIDGQVKIQRLEQDPLPYLPYLLGVLVFGGLLALPLLWGGNQHMEYGDALPWSLLSCVVFSIGIRRDGSYSLARGISAYFIAYVLAASFTADSIARSNGNKGFLAGGALGFLLLTVCGYLGVGFAVLLKRWFAPMRSQR